MSAQAMDAAERQQKESIQLVTFSNNLADLEMQLELSCNTVASRAYSAELISDQLMDEVLDKNPQSQHQRALYLVRKIRTAIGDSEQAENRMDTFVKILGREAPFRSLVKKMGKYIYIYTELITIIYSYIFVYEIYICAKFQRMSSQEEKKLRRC